MTRRRSRRFGEDGDQRTYVMCFRKKKMKSSEASRKAARWGQRKYECPVCGHWHLTKDRHEK